MQVVCSCGRIAATDLPRACPPAHVEWSITELEIRQVLEEGEVIEERLEGGRFTIRLVLGRAEQRPIHVVGAFSVAGDTIIVITVYEPTLDRWEPGFRRRLRP